MWKRCIFQPFWFFQKTAQLCWVVVSKPLDLQRLMGHLRKDNVHIFHLAPFYLKLCRWLGHSDLMKKWTQLAPLKIVISVLSNKAVLDYGHQSNWLLGSNFVITPIKVIMPKKIRLLFCHHFYCSITFIKDLRVRNIKLCVTKLLVPTIDT